MNFRTDHNLIFIPLARSLGPLSLAYTTNVFSSNHAVDGGSADKLTYAQIYVVSLGKLCPI